MANKGVGMLLENEGKFLLLHRSNEDLWECPKGHIEEGETDNDAIKRELFEETRISDFSLINKIGLLQFEFIRKLSGTVKKREITYYHLKTSNKMVVVSSEHDDFLWVSRKELFEKLKFEDIRDLLMNYFNLMDI